MENALLTAKRIIGPGRVLQVLPVIVILLAALACTTIPATGREELTWISLEDDISLGRSLRPKILAQFGGAYDDPELSAYVASIGDWLVQTSELPDIAFRFTILDTDIPNAFAAPGGEIYITRGALALVDNEAQLAAVLAHEIGHVTARHSARQIGHGSLLEVGMAVIGAAFKNDTVNTLARQGTQLFLLKYSRDHEYESDDLSLRYLARAGFDPKAMAGFLRKLHMHQDLQRKIAPGRYRPSPMEFLSTHPSSPRRIRRSLDRVEKSTPVPDPIVGRNVYLSKIRGLIYGKNREKRGYIEGRRFIHPGIGVRFEVPEGYRLRQETMYIVALGGDERRMLFDTDRRRGAVDALAYLTDVWVPGIDRAKVSRRSVGGREAAIVSGRQKDSRGDRITLAAVDWGEDTILRFVFRDDPKDEGGEDTLSSVLDSLDRVGAEAHRPGQRYIDIVTVETSQPLADLSHHMAFDRLRLERLATLNGLASDAIVRKGTRLKVVRRPPQGQEAGADSR